MKIFLPYNGLMNQDITATWPTLQAAKEFYHAKQPDLLIIEAPDYVFPSWGFDISKEGNERFIKPTPTPGWIYNDETGGFEPEDGVWPEPEQPESVALNALNKILEGYYGNV